ncbi:MAG: NAD(P)/FAD-dependent oxidoreductase [bacterium]
MQTKSQVDVVVIGAGISGLTAGALLSKAGLRVTVVEAGARPGGYLAGFERQGFVFDTAIQWLNQCLPGGYCYKVFHHLGAEAPQCKPLSRIRRYKGDSFDYLLTNEPHVLRDRLISDFPLEAAGIRRFFAHARVLGDRLQVLNNRMRALETMSLWEKTGYGLRMAHWVVPVWKHLKISAEKGLDRYFESDELKKMFCSEDSMMAVIVPIAWAFTGDIQSPPTGGSQAFVDWLCRRIRASGSQILLNHRAESILLQDNRAVGVSLDTGQEIAAEYVLAACDVETVYEKMLPPGVIPETLLRKLREADLYYSTVSVFLGLDCDPASLGFNEELVCVTRDDVSRADHSSGDPHKTSLIVIAPSVRDPRLAPEGKGTLTIHCPAFLDYNERWKTDEGRGRGEAYRAFKREFAETLIERVEKALAPELRQHIEVLEVATPVTYQRYTGNREGSIMGARPSNRNIKSKLAHYRTPVKNLLLGGHWSEYGGGLPVAMKSAANTSLLILKQSRKAAYEELRDVIDNDCAG